MENSIPKIIHYCWFGKGEMPKAEQNYINGWRKKLKDYTFILWNEDTFDVNSLEWTKEAYANKKYAFVSDYVRLYALEKFGGIYLDTDIKLRKKFDNLLNQEAFIGFEDGITLASCVIACKPHNKIIGQLEEMYHSMRYDMNNEIPNVKMITELFVSKGLKKDNTEQFIESFHIYPRTYFNPMDYFGNWDDSDDTYCVHCFFGSWLNEDEKFKLYERKRIIYKTKKRIRGIIKRLIKRIQQ